MASLGCNELTVSNSVSNGLVPNRWQAITWTGDDLVHWYPGGGGTPYMMGDTYVPRFWPPFLTLWVPNSYLFGVFFSHPPTQKRSFGYKSSQNLIFLDPKYHIPLDLFGSNFQWPTAHPQQFSDRVPPPGVPTKCNFGRHYWIYYPGALSLTHCGLVTPYGGGDLGQHWLR